MTVIDQTNSHKNCLDTPSRIIPFPTSGHPIVKTAFQHCPDCTPKEAEIQASILNLYARGVNFLSGGFKLLLFTVAGLASEVELILDKLDRHYINVCMVTTHAQNLLMLITGFDPEIQHRIVLSTITKISNHLEWYGLFQGETILEATLHNP